MKSKYRSLFKICSLALAVWRMAGVACAVSREVLRVYFKSCKSQVTEACEAEAPASMEDAIRNGIACDLVCIDHLMPGGGGAVFASTLAGEGFETALRNSLHIQKRPTDAFNNFLHTVEVQRVNGI